MSRVPRPDERLSSFARSAFNDIALARTPKPSTLKQQSERALRRLAKDLRDRAEGRCEISGIALPPGGGHKHHRQKRLGPQRDVLSNLLYLAPEYHLAMYTTGVHHSPKLARHRGWIVSDSVEFPGLVPVLLRYGTVQLLDNGLIVDLGAS